MTRYHYLTADECHQITAMRRLHRSQPEIAKAMSGSPITISRELQGNVTRHDGWCSAEKAHIARPAAKFFGMSSKIGIAQYIVTLRS